MHDLLEYLESNCNQNESDFKHSNLLQNIQGQFHRLTGQWIKKSYLEVDMVQGISSIGIVDLAVISHSDDLYLIEGKVVRSKNKYIGKTRHKINQQLKRAYYYFNDNFNIRPFLLGVYTPSRSDRIKMMIVSPDI
jgi:hypothetical protein